MPYHESERCDPPSSLLLPAQLRPTLPHNKVYDMPESKPCHVFMYRKRDNTKVSGMRRCDESVGGLWAAGVHILY